MYIHTDIYLYIYTHMYIYVYKYIYGYIYGYIYVYIHIYMYMHIYLFAFSCLLLLMISSKTLKYAHKYIYITTLLPPASAQAVLAGENHSCDVSALNQWLCNLPELHVFGGIQYSFLLQEALNF